MSITELLSEYTSELTSISLNLKILLINPESTPKRKREYCGHSSFIYIFLNKIFILPNRRKTFEEIYIGQPSSDCHDLLVITRCHDIAVR